jgi:hypothetical protein
MLIFRVSMILACDNFVIATARFGTGSKDRTATARMVDDGVVYRSIAQAIFADILNGPHGSTGRSGAKMLLWTCCH